MEHIPLIRMFLFGILCGVFLLFIPPLGALTLTFALLCLVAAIGRGMFISYGSWTGTNGFTFYRLFIVLIPSGIIFLVIGGINNFAGITALATVFQLVGFGAFVGAGISLLISIFKLLFM